MTCLLPHITFNLTIFDQKSHLDRYYKPQRQYTWDRRALFAGSCLPHCAEISQDHDISSFALYCYLTTTEVCSPKNCLSLGIIPSETVKKCHFFTHVPIFKQSDYLTNSCLSKLISISLAISSKSAQSKSESISRCIFRVWLVKRSLIGVQISTLTNPRQECYTHTGILKLSTRMEMRLLSLPAHGAGKAAYQLPRG